MQILLTYTVVRRYIRKQCARGNVRLKMDAVVRFLSEAFDVNKCLEEIKLPDSLQARLWHSS